MVKGFQHFSKPYERYHNVKDRLATWKIEKEILQSDHSDTSTESKQILTCTLSLSKNSYLKFIHEAFPMPRELDTNISLY